MKGACVVKGLGQWARQALLPLMATAGLWGVATPVMGQALLPYVLPLDSDRLEAQGLELAQEAAQLAQFQQYRDALARAELAAQLVPDDAAVLGLLGSLYLQVEDYGAAITALEQARRLEPTNAPVLFALGTAHFRQDQYAQAVSYLESGLRFEPDNPGALFDLGNAYFRLGRYDQAIARYRSSIEIEPDFWPSINNIGLVLYEQGDVDGAIAQWEASLAVAPEEPEPQLAIAVARYAQGQQGEVVTLGIAALERDSRYASLDFLAQNLWGDSLLADAQTFFDVPAVKAILAQL